MVGHVDGLEKTEILSSSWALINTSIHEGLAVSFLEALQCETPLISSVDPDGGVAIWPIHRSVSRFRRGAASTFCRSTYVFSGESLSGI
jgi:glycosyltransferase involved in cell wall biosynthesis